jgi:LmbE family N-acetylglucosaminyl deacetylase
MNSWKFRSHTATSKKGSDSSFKEILEVSDPSKESWVVVNPHDDDGIVGMALLILAAREQGVRVSALVVSDGSMGYRTPEHKETIVQVREEETLASYRMLGLSDEDVIFLRYPDCDLYAHKGRRPAQSGVVDLIAGHTGLINSFTYWFRKLQATQIYVPSDADIHPDHKVVHEQARMSAVFADSRMWPELGAGISPAIFREYQVYSAPQGEPDIQVESSLRMLETKMKAVDTFKSQGSMHGIVEKIRGEEPYEYFWTRGRELVDRQKYKTLFQD